MMNEINEMVNLINPLSFQTNLTLRFLPTFTVKLHPNINFTQLHFTFFKQNHLFAYQPTNSASHNYTRCITLHAHTQTHKEVKLVNT